MNMITTYAGQWGLSSEGTFKEKPWYSLSGAKVIEHGFGTPPNSFAIKQLPDGVIIPALVNAHTHLELSYLKNKIPVNSGMKQFIELVSKSRSQITPEEKRATALKALRYAYSRGTYFFNDISNDAEFSNILSSFPYFNGNRFYEILGFSPEISEKKIKEVDQIVRKYPDLIPTPHSLYGTSPILLEHIKEWRKTSLSIHLLETEDEYLLQKGEGKIFEFLKNINQYYEYSELKKKSFPDYLKKYNIFQYTNLFFIHLTYALDKDINLLSEYAPHASWVLCHRSNQFLGLERKNLQKLLKSPLKMLIGTDSLASCSDISILDELYALLAEDFTEESLLWQAATYSAYDFLGIQFHQVPFFFIPEAKPSIESIHGKEKAFLLHENLLSKESNDIAELEKLFDDFEEEDGDIEKC